MTPEQMISQLCVARDLVRDLRVTLGHMIVAGKDLEPEFLKAWNLAGDLILALETLIRKASRPEGHHPD
jgi:hypothetical protein